MASEEVSGGVRESGAGGGAGGVFLDAYELVANPGYGLEPAHPRREWMDASPFRTAYRCLPLVMANHAGWVVRSPCDMVFSWNGKVGTDALKVEIKDAGCAAAGVAGSNFGMGIITFRMPWLFRTPRGIGLWCHGHPNEPRDNLTALEGLVETEWLTSPFTMNWKIQRRNSPVYFKKGDAVCMLTPFPMDLLETVEPRVKSIASNPELQRAVNEAMKSRMAMVQGQNERDQEEAPDWEKKYVRGVTGDGTKYEGHRTNFRLRPFGAG